LTTLGQHPGNTDVGRLAEWRAKETLASAEEMLVIEHVLTTISIDALVDVLRSQGRDADAEPQLQRALAMTEAVLGPDHRLTAERLDHLADLYRAQGRHAEAEPLLSRARAIREIAGSGRAPP